MGKSIIKYITLFSSVIALILGVIVMTNLFASTIIINWLLVIALGIVGLSRICAFASSKDRSAWDLVSGILFLMVCLLLLSKDPATVGTTMGIVLAVVAILDGIGSFITAYIVRKASKKASIAGYILCGILLILLGIALFCMPLFGEILYIYIIGIFMVVLGICGLISGLFMKTK